MALNRQQGDVLRVGGTASPQWGNTRYLTIQGTARQWPTLSRTTYTSRNSRFRRSP